MTMPEEKDDITGQRFGRLTAISRADDYVSPDGRHRAVWLCQCDCGKQKKIRLINLLHNTKSCGCLAKELTHERSFKDITGQRFGRLVALSYRIENSHSIWRCQCDCGNVIEALGKDLHRGRKTSCGCWTHELISDAMRKHGGKGTRLFRIWTGIKTRCYNQNDRAYKNYGARGIVMCDEWLHDFKEFYDWASSNGYTDELTIERIDVDGIYEPSNCKWITLKEQARNRRNTKRYEYMGKLMRLDEISEASGMSVSALRYRLKNGMSADEAVNTPYRRRQRRA